MEQIWVYSSGVLLAYLTFVLSSSSPGPATLAIMRVSMDQGRQAGVIFALGVVCGSVCWGILAATGLTHVLLIYGSALEVIKLLGGMYLLWLALKAARSALQDDETITLFLVNQEKHGKLFSKGVALHLTNPKAALAWLAVVSVGLQHNAPTWVAVSIVVGCALLGLLIFLSYAFLFSNEHMIALYTRAKRPIDAVLAMIFGYAGAKLLSTEL